MAIRVEFLQLPFTGEYSSISRSIKLGVCTVVRLGIQMYVLLFLSWSTSSTSLTMPEQTEMNAHAMHTHSWYGRARARAPCEMRMGKHTRTERRVLVNDDTLCVLLSTLLLHSHSQLDTPNETWKREYWMRTHQAASSPARNDKNCFISLFIMQRVSFHPQWLVADDGSRIVFAQRDSGECVRAQVSLVYSL